MTASRKQHRRLAALISISLAGASLAGGVGAAAAGAQPTSCAPTVRALPLPAGQTNGDALAGVPGEAVGYVADDAQHQHVVIWRQHGRAWEVQDLGDLGFGAPFSGLSATGVNTHGQVSIGINTGVGMAGWLFSAGAVHQLKDFAGGTAAYARAINDAGVVVGEALDAKGGDFAAVWAHWWSRPTKLRPTTGYDGSFAQGVDDAGQVVGGAFSNGTLPTLAVRWNASGVPSVLASLGADAQAWDVSRLGGTVGAADTAGGQRAVRWDARGGVTNLGVFTGIAFSRLLGVNRHGLAVGWEGVNVAPPAIPVRRVLLNAPGGRARSLLPLTGNWADDALAHGIDDAGTVYGTSAVKPNSFTVPTVWTCALDQSFVP